MNVSVIVFPNQEEITHRVKYGTLIFLYEERYRPFVPLVILNILQLLPKYSNNNLILFVDILKVWGVVGRDCLIQQNACVHYFWFSVQSNSFDIFLFIFQARLV